MSNYARGPRPGLTLPAGAIRTDLPERIVTAATEPPDGKGWPHEIKHDGHHLVAIVADGAVKLLSRNARDRTEVFAEPFRALAAVGLPAMLDGAIAVPDARGVTHIDALTAAMRLPRAEQLAYLASIGTRALPRDPWRGRLGYPLALVAGWPDTTTRERDAVNGDWRRVVSTTRNGWSVRLPLRDDELVGARPRVLFTER